MKYLVWLQAVLGAGNDRSAEIIKHFGTAGNLYSLSPEMRKTSGLFKPSELQRMSRTTLSYAEAILKECAESGIRLVALGDDDYPYCLSVIANPPLILYVKGELPDFDEVPAICIVGPRKISEYGKKAAYSLGFRLAASGITVVSGGAVGSDYFAHSGAIKAGGKTVLVMGCGINSDYLAENANLRKKVTENGCLISEYPPQTPATRYSFPVRNRIMSALSVGTVVVEAGERSGALITAGCANEQGRDVFVIPGSPSATEYAGSNALLREGAKPLLDASDIFNEYIIRFPDKINIENAFKKAASEEKKPPVKNLLNETLSNEAKIVYNYLDKHKFYPEEIKNTGLSHEQLLSALTELEIELIIKALPGGMFEVRDR